MLNHEIRKLPNGTILTAKHKKYEKCDKGLKSMDHHFTWCWSALTKSLVRELTLWVR